MALFDELAELTDDVLGDGRRLVSHQLGLLAEKLKQDPRVVFALLREVRPVFVKGDLAVVTRFVDVVEVLTHDAEFSVVGYAEPMREITGDFILGLDQGPHYERDVSLLRLAFRQRDVPAVAELVTRAARGCVASALPRGRIDVVSDLADRVPAAVVEEYLGAPGPDQDTLITWARVLFTHIFVDLTDDRILQAEARAAAEAIRAHLDTVVASRKAGIAAGRAAPDDVLTRLLGQQVLGAEAFTDAEIRSQLVGMLVGTIPTISKASSLAIDELLSRPQELAGARQAVHDGDDALLARYASEAMRLAPQAPGLLRKAVVDYPIARGTHHERMIRKGMTVFASTQSAMMDDDVVEDPDEFRLDRPDSVYLHYGAGLHSCYGRYISAVAVPAVVKAALSIDGAVRAEGTAGQLAVDRTWPTSMTLEFPSQG
jgi:cytochrome P450